MRPARLGVVLVAHGSRDPRAGRATEALAAAVRADHPEWDVRASYLDHSVPRPRSALAALAAEGHERAVLVPLLLTAAYHGRVDVPGEITAARADGVRLGVELADVLGPVDGVVPELLLDGLMGRLAAASSAASSGGVACPGGASLPDGVARPGGASLPDGVARPGGVAFPGGVVRGLDALVLAAAGTRSAAARGTVELAAAALSARSGLPCRVAYASAAPPVSGDVVGDLRASGYERVGLVSYFLAPGLLWDTTAGSAREAGVRVVAEPLADAPELVALVAARVVAAAGRRPAAAAA
ncbi:sirohydrochlorin chelatase [Pseudosporangium ferrugineum]|uniref:CbiX protein n=1 Tax=Pseudosporangium ferrugineum TaxID=439699 RepID=A0A2T0SDK5_9ACTN|nr:CbiX/SirB N-terminal domain-containing protein [Pseudosporangium ferrugineum]PRY31497.1 CbiX protein [Pseudosporangium ferrugineum]